jgi:hypothetical protein
MQLDTGLHRTLGCRLSLHKLCLGEVVTFDETVEFLHEHQELMFTSSFDLI